jgi:hypothetical protein
MGIEAEMKAFVADFFGSVLGGVRLELESLRTR